MFIGWGDIMSAPAVVGSVTIATTIVAEFKLSDLQNRKALGGFCLPERSFL